MGQRNELGSHQMLDLKSDQGHIYLQPQYHIPPVNMANYPNQNTHPVMPTPVTAADPNFYQFADHHGRNVVHGNQLNATRYYHPASNFGVGGAVPFNVYYPGGFPTSSRNFAIPVNSGSFDQFPPSNIVAPRMVMDAYGRSNYLNDISRGSCKRKIAEGIEENYYNLSGTAHSNVSSADVSQSSGQQLQQEPHRLNSTLTSSDYPVAGIHTLGGLNRSVRSRPSSINLQPEPSFSHHQNYLLQGNYVDQSFQPPPNGWVEQNYYNNGGCYNWNYAGPLNYIHGTQPGPVGTVNMQVADYQDASSNRNFAFNLNPPSDNQHLPPGQSMPVHGYNQQSQIPMPSYWHPVTYLQTDNVYSSANDVDSASRFPRHFPSVAEQIYWSLPEPTQEVSYGSSGSQSSEDAGSLDFPPHYGFMGVGDQHGDLRMDIDGMTYEDLLALGEYIGHVNTGLSEDSILKNLKTSVYVPQTTSSLSDSSSQAADETCAICLVEYEENERLGSVNCGHKYHADCITRWLLIKNQCPVCKMSVVATGGE